ncbi:MAG: bifunctional hydroxymethylpyrimidine kinase/phosphomethylpyrimidine kinase [Treponemataceae bacterium]|nr:bifunctional hydroxymethylpyrimidine kinase/phosphomethylpyrimidine kinase [Treponemataceae bacterium]
MNTALTIAGSDSSGGAGIQADIKTFTSLGIYGMSAITSVTSQNTKGVQDILYLTPHIVESQIDSVFDDIFPDGVKIGMTGNSEIIEIIAQKLNNYQAKNVVLDPVMISTSGKILLEKNAVKDLMEKLFPVANLVTPNLSESQVIAGIEISSKAEMEEAAKIIFKKYGSPVLIKGGHLKNECSDFFYSGNEEYWFSEKKIENSNTHGTGCTLSSAICANLAKGMDMLHSIEDAKEYLTGAIKSNLNLGHGKGPLNHMWNLKG